MTIKKEKDRKFAGDAGRKIAFHGHTVSKGKAEG
jgi:hypothetical protein